MIETLSRPGASRRYLLDSEAVATKTRIETRRPKLSRKSSINSEAVATKTRIETIYI